MGQRSCFLYYFTTLSQLSRLFTVSLLIHLTLSQHNQLHAVECQDDYFYFLVNLTTIYQLHRLYGVEQGDSFCWFISQRLLCCIGYITQNKKFVFVPVKEIAVCYRTTRAIALAKEPPSTRPILSQLRPIYAFKSHSFHETFSHYIPTYAKDSRFIIYLQGFQLKYFTHISSFWCVLQIQPLSFFLFDHLTE